MTTCSNCGAQNGDELCANCGFITVETSREPVGSTAVLADLQLREAEEWVKLCELEQVCSAAERAAKRQFREWADAYHQSKTMETQTPAKEPEGYALAAKLLTESTERSVKAGSSSRGATGSGDLPSDEEMSLWRSRCAPVSGDWRDKALHRLCNALLAQSHPNDQVSCGKVPEAHDA